MKKSNVDPTQRNSCVFLGPIQRNAITPSQMHVDDLQGLRHHMFPFHGNAHCFCASQIVIQLIEACKVP